NPLSVVIGQATLMLATGEGGKIRVEKIARAAERCVRIVRNFLALARDRAPERSEVSINTVAREALELLAYELRTEGGERDEDLAAEVPKTWADPHQLHQVLVNLLANAQHAMRQVSERRLAVRTAFDPVERRVRIFVADNGPGVPVELGEALFAPLLHNKAGRAGHGPRPAAQPDAHRGSRRQADARGHAGRRGDVRRGSARDGVAGLRPRGHGYRGRA